MKTWWASYLINSVYSKFTGMIKTLDEAIKVLYNKRMELIEEVRKQEDEISQIKSDLELANSMRDKLNNFIKQ